MACFSEAKLQLPLTGIIALRFKIKPGLAAAKLLSFHEGLCYPSSRWADSN
jgi:hypothetical protein